MYFFSQWFFGVAHAASTNVINPNLPGPYDPGVYGVVGLIGNLYNYAFLIAGVLAFAMIVYGAIKYSIAGGDTGKEKDARDQITQAALGVVLLMGGYLILQTINPQLTILQLPTLDKITLSNQSLITLDYTSPAPPSSGGGPGSGGKCSPISGSGPCSVENLANTCFGNVATQASQVCSAESAGNPRNFNAGFRAASGQLLVYGLFQINLTANGLIVDCGTPNSVSQSNGKCLLPCNKAFNGKNTNATLVNPGLYNQCVALAQNSKVSIDTACSLYQNQRNANKWYDWQVTHSGFACYNKF